MKGIGYILMVVGLIAMVFAINMDVSVSTYGGRINNIGLISDRQNYLIFSCVIFLAGIILAIFGSKSEPVSGSGNVKCKYCAELIKSDAIICKHCGKNVEHEKETDDSGFLFTPIDHDRKFSFRDWPPEIFIAGGKVNKNTVYQFIYELKKSNPKLDSPGIVMKFYRDFSSIEKGLPDNLIDEFKELRKSALQQ
ncbi:MAG TPA: hypothetical protein DIT05_04490 [Morganella sp. (in: Bacteria)]|nr:hypothetical protein [Morganella sp. (in: enterobacteria)]